MKAPGGFAADMEVAWVDRAFWILPRMTALNVFAAVLLMPWYWPLLSGPVRAAWLGALGLFIAGRIGVIWRLKQWRARPDRRAEGSYRLWFVLALVSGLFWGLTASLLYVQGGPFEKMLLGFVLYGLCVLNAYHVSAKYLAFEINFVCSIGPLLVCIALPGDAKSVLGAVFVFLVIGGNGFLARFYLMNFRTFGEAMMLKLRQEKAAADEARRAADAARHEAEVANRAKTQFFAAASHDLRQPLHAMGLLAEALSRRSRHQAELAPLVASLNGSVGALEELFSELLDITKIDSGGVTAAPEHFEVGVLFRKLRLHFEPVAFDKGLSLRFRGAGQLLHADPVLVERILRNLVANAIRYTHDGSVLVSCRKRGARLQLQVWDSGVGIAEPDCERIFEEFYQVPGTQAQERKGLGLGLSIAQRLAALMGARLTLRSQPGRGSVFSLDLPAGDAARAQGLQEAWPSVPATRTLQGRTIVVVDDEPAVRAGLDALLGGWGAKVLAFDGVHAAESWARHADPEAARPDLMIVDYRLAGDSTGLQVIGGLRARFGNGVPAIMVTGSLAPDLDIGARERGFELMLKPVAPHRLRALVDFAVAQR